ncbi:site-specific DNA-methyltransferase [Methylobacter sp. Wu8]|uniref:site-specific DNA-methyltransferase n=1 Tax=Methylobacter sp. Wu8 TaxID=3118457 RepID=UPI002F2DCE02
MLIQGDNLQALKALLPLYAGKVKCIYIDPPYNTRSAFEYYDDNLEHSLWLSLIYARLELLRELLTEDGSIWVSIDDNEGHYLKVIMDEIFGRKNFINQVSVKMKLTAGASGGGEDKKLKKNIESLIAYAKNYDNGFKKFNDVYEEENLFDLIDEMEANEQSWKYTSILLDKGTFIEERIIMDGSGEPIRIKKYKGLKRTTVNDFTKNGQNRDDIYIDNYENLFSDTNAQTSIRTRIIDEFKSLEKDELLVASYVPKSGREKNTEVAHFYISPSIRRIIWLKDTAEKRGKLLFKKEKTGTYWQGLALNNLTKEGDVRFPNGKKPEALIQKILLLSTNENDLVLDSFLGSGTTAAVAHKMNRRYIGIEMGDHAKTHCQPRLKKVVEGEQGGISKAVNWQGGGGFHYFRLGETIFDEVGSIHHNVKFAALAAHIWFCETRAPLASRADSPLLGIHNDTAYYLLYNGILGDRRPQSGNVLTQAVLDSLPKHNGRKIIYGEASRFGKPRLEAENIVFKQIPYDVRAV